MKKTILSMLLAVMTVGLILSCKEKKPVKTDAELRADSIRKAKQDSIFSVANFKKESIATIEKFIKKKFSSDPDFGKVVETDDKILNDSIYFAKSRIVIKNDFGAKQQYTNVWFVFCRRKKNDPHFVFWPDSEHCQKGMNHIVGKDVALISNSFFIFKEKDYHKLVGCLCSNFLMSVDEVMKWYNN